MDDEDRLSVAPIADHRIDGDEQFPRDRGERGLLRLAASYEACGPLYEPVIGRWRQAKRPPIGNELRRLKMPEK